MDVEVPLWHVDLEFFEFICRSGILKIVFYLIFPLYCSFSLLNNSELIHTCCLVKKKITQQAQHVLFAHVAVQEIEVYSRALPV